MGDDITIGVTEIVNNIEVTAQPNDQIVDISVVDNADDVTLNITPTVIEININKGSSYAKWGDILGTLTDQTDLQSALNLKANLVGGKVPASELPSYVDDVVEVADYAALPATGETGKIYVTLDNNKIYRWSGSVYIEIAANSAIWGAITGTLSSQTDLVNALNLRVPYTGATSNVNLGEYGLTAGFLGLDTTPTSTPTGVGTIYWDAANRTAALIDGDGDTTLQIGQEQRILVHNNTGSTLTDGQVVYVTGSTGNLPSVSLANATSETTSAATVGVVTESIANGADGFITTSGIVNGLNTLAFNEGDLLWLSTTAGAFTTTKPASPAHLVLIGYVIKKAGGNGSILVKIQNTQELEESSDVLFTSLTDKDVLTYESSSSLWKNKSISTILGYTPANDSSVVHLSGTETITGIKSFTANVSFSGTSTMFDGAGGIFLKQFGLSDYNQIAALSGGFELFANSGTQFYFNIQPSTISFGLTNSKVTFDNSLLTANRTFNLPDTSGTLALSSQLHNAVTIGTANGLSLSTQVLSLGLASSSANGALSSTDWNTFNGKQTALSGTGFVKISGTTISYDNSTYVPTSRTLTINGTAYDLSADRSWTISAGISGSGTTGKIPLYTGSTALGDSSFTEFSTYVNLTKPLTIAYSTATSGQGLNLSLNNAGSTGTTLYLYNAGTGNLAQFQKSNNTTAFLINAAGNVGIGTTSPNYSSSGRTVVDINGTSQSMLALSVGGVGKSFLFYTGTDLLVSNESNGAIKFNTNGSEKAIITSSGNVGIGTTNPSEKLTLTNGKLFLTEADPTIGGKIYGYNDTSTDLYGGGLKFQSRYYDGANYVYADRLTIKGNGNVGIGTTSPQTKLDVRGAIQSIAASGTNGIGFGDYGADAGNFSLSARSGRNLVITDDYAGAERMRITSGGNVGIGTTSPSYKLDVAGVGRFLGTTPLTLERSGSTKYTFSLGASDDFYINNVNIGSTPLTILSSGNVGIGTTSPTQGKLVVVGNTYSEGLYVATGQFTQSGGTTSTFYTFSNVATNRVFMVTVRQSGGVANNMVGMAFAFSGNCGAYNIAQDNTNPVLFLTISTSGLDLRFTTGTGYGSTTWDYTITQIK